jgi:predicted ATPase
LQIQDAIQGNDKRQLHKSISLDINPTKSFCNVVYDETFEQSVRVAERMNSAFPVIAHGRTSQYAAELPDFSPDFTLIKKEDCGPVGVQAIAATIQAWMSRYELTFSQLERYRDNLARVNDVFAGEINQIATNLNNIQKLEKAKKIYIEAKTNIESVIDNFLTRINYLHYEIRKLLQEYYGRKVGWVIF